MFDQEQEVCLVKLEVGRIGVERQLTGEDALAAFGRQVDQRVVRATKKLLQCEEFDACNKVANKARATVARMAVPAPFIGGGFSLVKVAHYPAVVEALTAVRDELRIAVEKLVAVWPERVAASMVELARNGIPIEPSEYPSAEKVAMGFSVSFSPLQFSVPEALDRIDSDAFAEAKREAETRWNSAMEEAEKALATELRSMLTRAAERLSPGEDGERKIFRDSLVDNLREFLAEAPFRNVSNSGELADACEELKKLLGNETAESLRVSEGMRDIVRDGVEKIGRKLEDNIINRPERKVIFLNKKVGGES